MNVFYMSKILIHIQKKKKKKDCHFNKVILFLGFGFIAGFLEEQMYRWLRAAELTCDRAALLVVQDPKVPFFSTNKTLDKCISKVTNSWIKSIIEYK